MGVFRRRAWMTFKGAFGGFLELGFRNFYVLGERKCISSLLDFERFLVSRNRFVRAVVHPFTSVKNSSTRHRLRRNRRAPISRHRSCRGMGAPWPQGSFVNL